MPFSAGGMILNQTFNTIGRSTLFFNPIGIRSLEIGVGRPYRRWRVRVRIVDGACITAAPPGALRNELAREAVLTSRGTRTGMRAGRKGSTSHGSALEPGPAGGWEHATDAVWKSSASRPGLNPAQFAGHMGSLQEHRKDRKSTRLNSSHVALSRMPSSA